MAVFRVDKSKDYTVMSNHHLRNKDLSLKAKGLLSLMLSLPDDWDYSLDGLVYLCKEGKDSVRVALAELKAAGYIVITKANSSETGKFEYVYDVYETPQGILPAMDNPYMDNPAMDNPTQLNTNIENTNKVSTDVSKEKKVQKRDALTEILDENEPTASHQDLKQSFIDFIAMRKKIRKPLTEKGLMLAINKAYQLANGDPDKMVKIVDQSVMNSWQGLFELREERTPFKTSNKPVVAKPMDAMAQLEALAAEEGVAL